MADDMKGKKFLVTAKVADRSAQGFNGFWSGGVQFANGQSTQLVDGERLEEVKADPNVAVIDVKEAPQGRAAPAPAPAPQATMSGTEREQESKPADVEAFPARPLRRK